MFSFLLRNIPLTLLVLSLILNGFLFLANNNSKSKARDFQDTAVSLEADLFTCKSANTGWESSYDDLLASCQIQSNVIVQLGTQLQEERGKSGDVIRDIILMSPEEEGQECSQRSEPTTLGVLNENRVSPTARLDDKLPDGLLRALQRAYTGNSADTQSATPNP